jgi:hypothetical protein
MHRLRSAVLLALLAACAPPKPMKPAPGAHTCYRTTGPLLSPAAAPAATWLVLTDSGRVAAGARWYEAQVVTGRESRPVQWQSSGTGAFRVRWANAGTMELAEARGILTGTARSGTQSWRVNALREDCPREF